MTEEENGNDVIVDDDYLVEDDDNDVLEVTCLHVKNKGRRPWGV